MLLAGIVPLFLAVLLAVLLTVQVLYFRNPLSAVLFAVFSYFWAILLSLAGLTCLLRQQSR